jgi:anti-sigma factor RsiW
MNCKKIRELILTDYIDGQADANEKMAVESHAALCPGCKEFLTAAAAVGPCRVPAKDEEYSADLIWQRVKCEISAPKEKRAGIFAYLSGKMRFAGYMPRPAFALATAFTLVLVLGMAAKLAVNNINPHNAAAPYEYSDGSDPLSGAATAVSADEEEGFGTSLESYFL